MGIFNKNTKRSPLDIELDFRSSKGYKVVQKTELEAFVTHKDFGGYLLFVKPDNTVSAYSCDTNPFHESNGLLDKLKTKWR